MQHKIFSFRETLFVFQHLEAGDRADRDPGVHSDGSSLTSRKAKTVAGKVGARAAGKFDELEGALESNTGIKHAVNQLLDESISAPKRIDTLRAALRPGEPIKYNSMVFSLSQDSRSVACTVGGERYALNAGDKTIDPRLLDAIRMNQGLRQPRSAGPVDPSTFDWAK